MPRVQRTVRNETLKNAFKNFFVPVVSTKFRVVALRCLWDVAQEDLDIASFNIFQKRHQIEKFVNDSSDVVLYFSCLCAMESSEMRKKILKRKAMDKDSDSDDDLSSYNQDSLISGM